MPDERILLVKGSAGLGNRILALLTAIVYARLSGRKLVVDWSDPVYSADNRNAFAHYFECALCSTPDSIPDNVPAVPAIWSGQLHTHAREMLRLQTPGRKAGVREWRRSSVDLTRLDYPEQVAVFWSYFEQVHLLRRHFRGDTGAFRRMKTREILRSVLRENLKPAQSIRERVSGIRRAWPPGESIGVHIRFTDKRSRIGAIMKRLDKLTRQRPDRIIFLATDSREAQRIVTERFPRAISTSKWLPGGERPLHLDRSCPDRLESGAAAMVDLYLLAGCDYLVHDEGSSFAYVASLLADTDRSRIHNVNSTRWLPPRLRHILWTFSYTWKVVGRLWP